MTPELEKKLRVIMGDWLNESVELFAHAYHSDCDREKLLRAFIPVVVVAKGYSNTLERDLANVLENVISSVRDNKP